MLEGMPTNPTATELNEVVLLGTHPRHPTMAILVLGTTGEADWAGVVGLVDTALGAQRLDGEQVGLMIVDVRNDVVRAARALRRHR
jgi:hypothetical protein